MPRIRGLRFVLWPLCAVAALTLLGAARKPLGPTPRLVPFDPAAAGYVRILDGPPRTEHDVANTGQGPLRYVYVVAKATQQR